MERSDFPNYIIFDPSKNITALVDSKVDVKDFKDVAKKIIDREPSVEQVGFLSSEEDADIALRMAGDEFCGNATMCAAVYYGIKNNLSDAKVRVKVYSIDNLLEVDIKKINKNEWEGTLMMPKPTEIKDVTFLDGKKYPVIFFSSIAHVIIKNDLDNTFLKSYAESEIKKWCEFLNVKSLGIMYYDENDKKLTPLVYVKSVDTLFWENACASGTAAIGYWLSYEKNDLVNIDVVQPSKSILTVFTDENKNLYLKGKINCDI